MKEFKFKEGVEYKIRFVENLNSFLYLFNQHTSAYTSRTPTCPICATLNKPKCDCPDSNCSNCQEERILNKGW